jgi:uncharacterized membrane protein HdeD (DUF308 family)
VAVDLTTTNTLLAIMAGVSVLVGAGVVAVSIAVVLLCRGVLQAVRRLEHQQLTPAMARVNAILDDVHGVTSAVKAETGRLDRLAEWMVDRLRPTRRASAAKRSTKVM